MSQGDRSAGFEPLDPVPVSQEEYERTIHAWDGSRLAEVRSHRPGARPEECLGCRKVQETVAFHRLQARGSAVDRPVVKVRWQGEVVGFIESARREVTSEGSHKLKGRWHPLASAFTQAFLRRLEESKRRADEGGHLEVDCPDQYLQVRFSKHPVTGEAWLTCRLKANA